MKTDLSLTKLTSGISQFFHRFHATIFVLVVIGGLAAAVFVLNQSLQDSAKANPNGGQSASFDKATINQVNQLKASTNTSGGISLPPGRTNPFIE